MTQHLVVAGFLHVENLAFQRENRLESTIAALFGSAACALTLDEVEFATLRVALRAVCQLTRQSAAIQGALATREVASLAGRLSRARCFDGFVDDLAGHRRVLLEKSAEPLIYKCLHDSGNIRVQLALRLPLELRLRKLHADHGHQSFAHVIPAQVFLYVLEK